MRALFRGLPPWYDVPGWFRAVFSRDAHPFLQFVRYGVAGVLAMATNVVVFALAEHLVFPVASAGEAEVLSLPDRWGEVGSWLGEMGENERVLNYARCNVIAFLGANIVAYVLNFMWVFQSGRHARHIEIFLFLGVSFVAFLVGTALAGVLVGNFGVNEYVAKMGDVAAAVLLNYVCRKFLIFQN